MKLDKQKTSVLIIGIIIGVVAGVVATRFYYQKKIISQQDEINSLGSGQEQLNSFTYNPKEIFSISGHVEEVGKNSLKMAGYLPPRGEKKDYLIKISDQTKITKNEILLDFSKTTQGTSSPPFKQTEIKLSDLKAGDNITAVANENIKDKTEFEAKYVVLSLPLEMEKSTPPANPSK